MTPFPALSPPCPGYSSLSFLSAHSLSSPAALLGSGLFLFLFPLLIQTHSLSVSLSVLSLSPPPRSPHTLDLLAALSKISTPSNTGLPVTSYFIQLEGIKAIKSKRSRQAPVKLSPHGPFPSLFLSFSTKAAPVSPPTASHPHLACFSVWPGLFPAPTVGSEKASDRC